MSSSVYGPFFFESAVNQRTYIDLITNKFITQLKITNKLKYTEHFIFEQDLIPSRISNQVLSKLKQIFKVLF